MLRVSKYILISGKYSRYLELELLKRQRFHRIGSVKYHSAPNIRVYIRQIRRTFGAAEYIRQNVCIRWKFYCIRRKFYYCPSSCHQCSYRRHIPATTPVIYRLFQLIALTFSLHEQFESFLSIVQKN